MALRIVEERRRSPRIEFQGRLEIDALRPKAHLEASSVNLSEGGACVRLHEELEIRSLVKLRLFAEPRKRPFECAGRVAWVIQRLDLRDVPPFVYDVGLEFLEPPLRLRQLACRAGLGGKQPPGGRQMRAVHLRPALLHGRTYVPNLAQEPSAGSRWHLIVRVEGAACFSKHCASEQEAIETWERFKRQAALP